MKQPDQQEGNTMTRIAYFDCFSGCSGDMILGALLDAGLGLDILEQGLNALNINGYRLTAEKVNKSGIAATTFNVIEEHAERRRHRGLTEILKIIDSSSLSGGVKHKSSVIFRKLGEVEAAIHGIPIEEVQFHELGALDTIIDIVGTIYALETVKIKRVYASPLPAGHGKISTAHGILPAPVPATLQLLAMANAPLTDAPDPAVVPGELITPTGAVLLTSLVSSFEQPDMRVTRIGYGAGSKDFKTWPNIMRIWIGEENAPAGHDELTLLETNIDDMNPEIYGFLMEKLLSEKAADVWFTPIQMKKNRPAVMLSVLALPGSEGRLTEIIMQETSTLGIRTRKVSRHVARREIVEMDSSLGHARAKVKRFGGRLLSISPEYEDCRRIALERDLPLREVYRIVELEFRRKIDGK
jgi:uncharacterized protein (TIGR00299 family) protein